MLDASRYGQGVVSGTWLAQSLQQGEEGDHSMVRMRAPFNLDTFLGKAEQGTTTLSTPKEQILFSQGDTADAVFYIQAGKVKVTVVSEHGKEAVVAILEQGAVLGKV